VLLCLPMRLAVIVLLLMSATSLAQSKADSFDQLASDFWTWRARYRPFTFDDVPRMEHAGGMRDWSAAAIASQLLELAAFERRLKAMPEGTWPVAQQVDHRLMGSAMARVRWELDVNPRWRRDPVFYIEQTVVALQEELMPPPPFSEARSREIVVRVENIPSILEEAKANLKPVRPCAQLAIDSLAEIDARLPRVESGVAPMLTSDDLRSRLHVAIPKAVNAFVEYRRWMQDRLPAMREDSAIGKEAYVFFLRQVALLPYTPEQLLTMARQDLDRVLAAQAYESQRDLGLPELKMAANSEEEMARMARDEASIRRYLVQREILTVPPDAPHWTFRLAQIMLPHSPASANLTTSRCHRARRTDFGGSCRSQKILPISTRPMRKMRAPPECTKVCRVIFFSCLWPGGIRTRSGATTTIPARTKGSAFTPKR
jgi:hypothetical protein